MKKITILVASMLLLVTTVKANELVLADFSKKEGLTSRYRFMQPIKFVERGVEFFIYPNGELDFSTKTAYQFRRSSLRNPFYAKHRKGVHAKKRMRVYYNRFGQVARVGNVHIDYTRFGKIKSIGTVNVHYDRRGLINKVGGLYVKYTPKGKLMKHRGYVNRHSVWYGMFAKQKDRLVYKKDITRVYSRKRK